MQYILSEKEYNELQLTGRDGTRVGVTENQLQKLCTEIADTMPVQWGWGGPDPKPWGCIITNGKKEIAEEWYCDKCPVHNICPYQWKMHSK